MNRQRFLVHTLNLTINSPLSSHFLLFFTFLRIPPDRKIKITLQPFYCLSTNYTHSPFSSLIYFEKPGFFLYLSFKFQFCKRFAYQGILRHWVSGRSVKPRLRFLISIEIELCCNDDASFFVIWIFPNRTSPPSISQRWNAWTNPQCLNILPLLVSLWNCGPSFPKQVYAYELRPPHQNLVWFFQKQSSGSPLNNLPPFCLLEPCFFLPQILPKDNLNQEAIVYKERRLPYFLIFSLRFLVSPVFFGKSITVS